MDSIPGFSKAIKATRKVGGRRNISLQPVSKMLNTNSEAFKVKMKSIQKQKNMKKARRRAFVKEGDEAEARKARRQAFLREDREQEEMRKRRQAFLAQDRKPKQTTRVAVRKRRDRPLEATKRAITTRVPLSNRLIEGAKLNKNTKAQLYDMALRINNRKNISFKKGKGLSTFTKQALIKFIMENK